MDKFFDKTEEYEKNLKDKIHSLIKYCSQEGIPIFISACIKNTEDVSEYKSDMVSAAAAGVRLKDDRLVRYVNVLNGFDTVPKRDDFFMENE